MKKDGKKSGHVYVKCIPCLSKAYRLETSCNTSLGGKKAFKLIKRM